MSDELKGMGKELDALVRKVNSFLVKEKPKKKKRTVGTDHYEPHQNDPLLDAQTTELSNKMADL